MVLEAFVLGTSGMMPLPGRHLTSVLLRREGELFLFDCGEGTQVSLRKLNLRWKKISAIFVTHSHADHVTGLPGMLMLSAQVERDDPLVIVGPPRTREYVEANRRILDMYINYPIEIVDVDPRTSGVVYERDGFKVRSHPLSHTKPCVAYALEEDQRPGEFHPDRALELGVPRGPLWSKLQAGEAVPASSGRMVSPVEVMGSPRPGRKFSFVTDTVPVPGIAEFVAGSNLLICEGMFEDALIESAREKRHLTARQAAEIARDGRVRSMGLTHYSPRYTKRELDKLLEEAQGIFPGTFLSRDGQNIPIPFEDSSG
jgi:ribonuclease Z